MKLRILTLVVALGLADIASAADTNPPTANPGGPYVFGAIVATQGMWFATLDGSASTDDVAIASYTWSFGDGSTVTTNVPRISHLWSRDGDWPVWLTVADTSGLEGSNSTTVSFQPGPAPAPLIVATNLVNESSATNGAWTARFRGTNAVPEFRIWRYNWDFANTRAATNNPTSTTYSNVGNYVVTLSTVYHTGQTNWTNFTVTVTNNGPPTAVIGGSTTLDETTATNGAWSALFWGTNSTDDSLRIWKYEWDFGNGKTTNGAVVRTTYTNTGSYLVTLTVTDHAGQTNATTRTVTVVTNPPPAPLIIATNLVNETTATNGGWTARFRGTNATPNFRIWKYNWDFGNSRTATNNPTSTIYSNVGNYLVTLTATYHTGQTNATNFTVTVTNNAPPTAIIGGSSVVDETTATNGAWSALFWGTNSTDDSLRIWKYEWDFGNGKTTNGSVVRTTYTNTGAYLVTLTVTDHAGQTNATTRLVNVVTNPPPAPLIIATNIVDETSATNGVWTARFRGTNAIPNFRIWKYNWDFGNTRTATNNPTSTTYSNVGNYLVTLTATYHTGQTNSADFLVTITNNAPPVAVIGGPSVVDEATATNNIWSAVFWGTNSTDDSLRIWKYEWNFGNGKTTNGAVVRTTYTNTGSYLVTLTVTDHAGQSNTTTRTVQVIGNEPPQAVIGGRTVVDESTATNQVWSALFWATNSTDDSARIWRYQWDLGNGKTTNAAVVRTTYTNMGNYLVTLTVTDHAGQTNATTQLVTVTNNLPPIAVIGGPNVIDESTATNGIWTAVFWGTNSTDDSMRLWKYYWDFGNGKTTNGTVVRTTYTNPGPYVVTLTVTDHSGQTNATTRALSVTNNLPPIAVITASTLSPEGAEPVLLSGASSTDDYGISAYRWFLPPRRFDFPGRALDLTEWRAANVRQDEKLLVTGNNAWGSSYFFTVGLNIARGGWVEGRVETPTNTVSHAMVGLRNLNSTSGHYNQMQYAMYFSTGAVFIYHSGTNQGRVTNYTRGTAYDFRIETTPLSGARYYLRASDSGQPFARIFETSYGTSNAFGFGADVYAGTFAFDQVVLGGVYLEGRDVTTPVFPGGVVTLQVVDNAMQTNATSVTVLPVTNAPPVAVIIGPNDGSAGTALTYDAHLSSDDHGIASYTWDFGDGTPLGIGPIVSHQYRSPGLYTNTLTILDFAGQRSTATIEVTITDAYSLVCVPWSIIGAVEVPHPTYSGKTNTLKAVARGISPPFTNVWDFGDGTGTVTNIITATNAAKVYNLEVRHAYTGGPGTPFYATATVYLTNGIVLTDTYPLQLEAKSLRVERHVAIDEGLWYLQKTQYLYDIDANNKGGRWVYTAYGTYYYNVTASAVQAFGVNGHQLIGDSNEDPYVETVQRGINYLLAGLVTVGIGPQVYGNPDANQNGIGLAAPGTRPIYETAPIMEALVAAARPEMVATVGSGDVKGRSFQEIMQDMVDVYCWGQHDSATVGGGWRYAWNDAPDNSAAQWAAIGLMAAERHWGILVPDWVKQRNLVWVNYSKDTLGFGYTGPAHGDATTPCGMVQVAFDGIWTTNTLWRMGENFLATNWSRLMTGNNLYAHFAIAKALRTAVPKPVERLTATGKDWLKDATNGLERVTIDHQRVDGSWLGSATGYVNDYQLATAWSILILGPIFDEGPSARIEVHPNPTAVGYPTVFDGRSSYHRNEAYEIAEYRWDFDASDGLDFERPDAVGPVVTNYYSALGTNIVTLQVRDNSLAQLTDIDDVIVRVTIPPFPPTALAGGPYVAVVGEDVLLDGSASFDVDEAAGDFIQAYDWEVDYQIPMDFNDGVTGPFATISGGYSSAGQYGLGLRVTDSTSTMLPGQPDKTDTNFTYVEVYARVITNLQARAKDKKIQLAWTKVGDYNVVRRSRLGPNHGFDDAAWTNTTLSTFLDVNADYDTNYYYRVYAYQYGRSKPVGLSEAVHVLATPLLGANALASQDTPYTLADCAININGSLYFLGRGAPLPAGVDLSGFDPATGLGTFSVGVAGFGLQHVSVLVDPEITQTANTFFNESGALVGSLAPGQVWEIDEPGYRAGNLYSNFLSGRLDNFNGVPASAADDVAMALGWNFDLSPMRTALMQVTISESMPLFGACLAHRDLGSGRTLYFSSTLSMGDCFTPPCLTCPTNMTLEAAPGSCAVSNVTYLALYVNPSPQSVVCVPPSGSTFQLGSTVVTCTATNLSEQPTNCSFTVTVIGQPLSMQCPANLVIECASPDGQPVDYAMPALGGCNVPITLNCVPPSGSTFPLGATAIDCTATDNVGTSVACSFSVFLAGTNCTGLFNLVTSTCQAGEVLAEPSLPVYPCGTCVQLTGNAAVGWTFMGWMGDVSSTNSSVSLTMTESKCVQAVFGTPVSMEQAEHGLAWLEPAATLYPCNTQVRAFARPAEGYYFSHWTNAIIESVVPLDLTVDRPNLQLSPVFLPLPPSQFALTVETRGYGQVRGPLNFLASRYDAGSNVFVHAIPDPGQAFLGWTWAGGTNFSPILVNPFSVVMNTNQYLVAHFTSRPWIEIIRCQGQQARDIFRFKVHGTLGSTYVIEMAPTVNDPAAWREVARELNFLGAVQYVAPDMPNAPQRFYRARLLP